MTHKKCFKCEVLLKWRYTKLVSVFWVEDIVSIHPPRPHFLPLYLVTKLPPLSSKLHRARDIIFLTFIRGLCSDKLQCTVFIPFIKWPTQSIWHSWHFSTEHSSSLDLLDVILGGFLISLVFFSGFLKLLIFTLSLAFLPWKSSYSFMQPRLRICSLSLSPRRLSANLTTPRL